MSEHWWDAYWRQDALEEIEIPGRAEHQELLERVAKLEEQVAALQELVSGLRSC